MCDGIFTFFKVRVSGTGIKTMCVLSRCCVPLIINCDFGYIVRVKIKRVFLIIIHSRCFVHGDINQEVSGSRPGGNY